MYDTAAVQIAITTTVSFAVAFSFLAILRDPCWEIYRMHKEKSSKRYSDRYFIGFIPHMWNMANLQLTLWYATPLLHIFDGPNIAIPGAGIIAEIAFAVSVIIYADSKKKAIFGALMTSTALVVPWELLGYDFLDHYTRESRGHFLGVTLTVSTFVAVVFTLFDLRLIWKNDEITDQPFMSVVCNLCGSANMCGLGVLTHSKFMWIRYAILSVANGIIFVAMVLYYRSTGERPYDGLVEFVRSCFCTDESAGPDIEALSRLEDGLLEVDECLVDLIAQLMELQVLASTELRRVRVSRVRAARADPKVASSSRTRPEIVEVLEDDD